MSEFWDNLIPIRSSLSGEQLAGWAPKRAAMSGLGCHLLADQRIPVDGGVRLSADVYTPKRHGRYPAVVQFAAYSRELHTAGVPTGSNEIGSPSVFTDRGYAPVVVTRRGMGRSQGEAVSHGHVHFDLPVPPYLSRNTLHYGPETYLVLPMSRLKSDWFGHNWMHAGFTAGLFLLAVTPIFARAVGLPLLLDCAV